MAKSLKCLLRAEAKGPAYLLSTVARGPVYLLSAEASLTMRCNSFRDKTDLRTHLSLYNIEELDVRVGVCLPSPGEEPNFHPFPWCHPSAVFLEDPSRSQPEVGVPDLVGSK